MKRFISLLFLLASFFSIYAQNLTRTEIVSVATNTLRRLGKSVNIADVDSIYIIQKNNHTIIQEVVFSSGESVLLAGHKSCRPVIGYTLPQTVGSSPILKDYNKIPEEIRNVLDFYSIQVDTCFKTNQVLPINQEWLSMQNYSQSRTSDIIIVEPLLSSKWGQDTSNCGLDPKAYNYFVSESSNSCTHCYAGCGPVAMAQIMYYWKHPVLSSLLEDSFDWCNMTDCLNTQSVNYIKERNAVARLIRQCGRAANARYCLSECSTGANMDEMAEALQSLGYECEFVDRDDCTNCDWIDMIKSDLDNGRPILYSGLGYGSHAFVCDGYSSEGFFHFNWGWNGEHNDLWFTLDDICPGAFNFSHIQKVVYKIEPSSEQNYCDFSIPLDDYYNLIITLYGNVGPLYSVTPRMMTVLQSASSSSPSSWRTIPASATAEYVAHKEVILQPGFTAEYGSNFTARIEPCEACEERMVQMEMLTGGENENIENITDTSGYEIQVFKSGDTVILSQPSSLLLYPNPTDNTITVRSPEKIENILILDNVGRPIFRWFIESNADGLLTLNVRDIPNGVYILQLTASDKKTHFGRFIKN